MNWEKFQVGFWHPFGDHGKESADQILKRKARECKNNGWTLWSFQVRNEKNTLIPWIEYIKRSRKGSIYVLCSEGKSTKYPMGDTHKYKKFREINSEHWQKVPSNIKVPHPGGNKRYATGFVVKRVIKIDERNRDVPFGTQWLRIKDHKWKNDKLPTRPEYILRRRGKIKPRRVRAVLELKSPYVVILKRD